MRARRSPVFLRGGGRVVARVPTCHPEKRHNAHGLCGTCYYRAWLANALPKQPPRAARFWALVNKSGPVVPYVGTPCWDWTGPISRDIGWFESKGAHRAAWTLTVGSIPDGLCVCHRCDRPICVRPDHLFLGTNTENVHDMIAKGRHACGERVSKLTTVQVLAIRADDRPYRVIAAEYGVHKRSIAAIRQRRSWRHVADEVIPPATWIADAVDNLNATYAATLYAAAMFLVAKGARDADGG